MRFRVKWDYVFKSVGGRRLERRRKSKKVLTLMLKRLVSSQYRMSQAESMSNPRPYAIPCTAAMTGTRHLSMEEIATWNSCLFPDRRGQYCVRNGAVWLIGMRISHQRSAGRWGTGTERVISPVTVVSGASLRGIEEKRTSMRGLKARAALDGSASCAAKPAVSFT